MPTFDAEWPMLVCHAREHSLLNVSDAISFSRPFSSAAITSRREIDLIKGVTPDAPEWGWEKSR
jgi:hypothetical protein